tara:strand:- start:3873 stop:4238 length:366 start_codon:yes stop_codon:yes gene_type:complete
LVGVDEEFVLIRSIKIPDNYKKFLFLSFLNSSIKNDNYPNFVIAPNASDAVTLFQNNWNGDFENQISVDLDLGQVYEVVAIDLDLDSHIDIIACQNPRGCSIYYNNEDWEFTGPVRLPAFN